MANNDPAALAAAAAGGTAGLSAYQKGKQDLETSRVAALQAAQARAKLLGGPEAQGFETLTNAEFDRQARNLDSSDAADRAQAAAINAASANYNSRIKSALPVINAETARILAGYESKAKASAAKNFPLAQILGSTEIALPGAQKAAEEAGTHADTATKNLETQRTGANLAPIQANIDNNNRRIKEIEGYSKGGLSGGLNIVKGAIFGHDKGLLDNKNVQDLASEKARLLADNDHLGQQYRATKAYNDLQLRENPVEGPGRVKSLQADKATKAAGATQVGLARSIAQKQYGLPQELVYGKINEKTFAPENAAELTAANQLLGPKVTGLAQKLDIPPTKVATILADEFVQQVLADVVNTKDKDSYAQKTWKEYQAKLAENFLAPGSDNYDPDTYAVLADQLKDLPWKKEKR